MASRSVTGILGKVHYAGVKGIPFHRIVYANGQVWINAKYRKKRLELYKKEKIKLDKKDKIIDFNKILFEFK